MPPAHHASVSVCLFCTKVQILTQKTLLASDESVPPAHHASASRARRDWMGVVTAYEVEESSGRLAEKMGVGAVDVSLTKRKLFAITLNIIFHDKVNMYMYVFVCVCVHAYTHIHLYIYIYTLT